MLFKGIGPQGLPRDLCPEHVLTDELIALPNTQKGRRPPFALAALGSPETSQDIKSHSQEPQP